MTWDDATKEFLDKINQVLSQARYSESLSLQARIRKNNIAIAGRKFYASINELYDIVDNKQFLLDLIIRANNTMAVPSPNNGVNLVKKVNQLESLLADNTTLRRAVGRAFAKDVVFGAAGGAGAVVGFLMLAGVITLPINIWAVIVLGIALTIVGGAVAYVEAQEASKHHRFGKDSQIKEIKEFTEVLTGQSLMLSEQQSTPDIEMKDFSIHEPVTP